MTEVGTKPTRNPQEGTEGQIHHHTWLTAGLAFIGAFSMLSTPSIAQASARLFKAVTSSGRWFYYPPHFAEMKGEKV